ncbi:Deoxyribodipyrimidine photo-lyase [Sphingomonas antarctica]|uniref:cryptochrome/photolyase family protein n=1 Tax=Sphingomonas antarctica TaxID=2040274 RepID=UPI0039EB08D9
MAALTILWFRQDLRLADNHALTAAAGEGPVLALYILDDETPGDDRIGGAQRWWLHHSLTAMGKAIAAKGGKLVLRKGKSAQVIRAVADEVGASRIHATRLYEPWWQDADADLADHVDLQLHDGNHLAPPRDILTGSGGRYRIFTPFWRALLDTLPPRDPLPVPRAIDWGDAKSDKLDDWQLLPTRPDWSLGFDLWSPGEDGAKARLKRFLGHVGNYDERRNFPSERGSSELSPHLHFGEISPATIWHALDGQSGRMPFLRELGWRDFAANSMDVFPKIAREQGRSLGLRWRGGKAADDDFHAWTRGRTGYPIVDAGMRQLWTTGWMHNRVRMIAASFLIKHLLIDWRRGERWFWDTLVDADYGNNSVNWQWVAGTGVDASLFTRIMAPLGQSGKFDAGDYIRQWVPELAALHDDVIHDPHGLDAAPADYPEPLIGHREARERALAAYRASR